jgi:integrase
MSLYKRGEFWHFEFVLDGERHRGSTGERSKTRARAVEEDQRRAIRDRAKLGKAPAEVLTLQAVADKWFAARAEGRKSAATTAIRVEIAVRLAGPYTLISDLDAPEIADAMQARRLQRTRQGRLPANATVNRDLIDTTLRPILRYAKRVLKQPVNDIEWSELRLPEPKERVRQFTPEELAAWADHLPSWHLPVRDFLGRYGVRLKEAFFPLDAVNTETWEITVRGPQRKNGRPHVIPLLPEDARDIAARLGRAKSAGLNTIWFRELKNGTLRPVHWRGYQSAAKSALAKAGITDARPAHDLRHHAGTAAMRASGNLKVVQALLGHENIQSTARYAHANQSDVRAALMLISQGVPTKSPTQADTEEDKPCDIKALRA